MERRKDGIEVTPKELALFHVLDEVTTVLTWTEPSLEKQEEYSRKLLELSIKVFDKLCYISLILQPIMLVQKQDYDSDKSLQFSIYQLIVDNVRQSTLPYSTMESVIEHVHNMGIFDASSHMDYDPNHTHYLQYLRELSVTPDSLDRPSTTGEILLKTIVVLTIRFLLQWVEEKLSERAQSSDTKTQQDGLIGMDIYFAASILASITDSVSTTLLLMRDYKSLDLTNTEADYSHPAYYVASFVASVIKTSCEYLDVDYTEPLLHIEELYGHLISIFYNRPSESDSNAIERFRYILPNLILDRLTEILTLDSEEKEEGTKE